MVDLTGQKFGRLKALKQNGKTKDGYIKWLCQCDCGKIVTSNGDSLRRKLTKSCGCLSSEKARERSKQRASTYIDENNPQWKGDNAGKVAMHNWVRKNKIKPHFCERCNERPAKELSYKYNKGWSRKPEDYQYLCYSCHKLKDNGNEAKPMDKLQIQEVRKLYDLDGYTRRKLAELFKVSYYNISQIIKYQGIYAE